MSNPIIGLACPGPQIKTTFSPKEKQCGCQTMQPTKHAPIKYGDPINTLDDYGSLIIDSITGDAFDTQVHILNLNNGQGAVTGANGQFVIKALPTDQLKITHVGYGEVIVTASDLTDKVVLNEVSENLDEVVIGSKSKNGGLVLLGLAAVFAVVYASSDDDKKSS
ncbi:hypothetical protein [uncultured Tenacibaculum sp.]|uniref:hypothetical protein n=1 Tax=uncultured Tenacibaculum sp. TaxID=174713 RepID=UPI0026319112|nr:hypothetical protein [uncultured Tenacibaculum sp.]